MSLWMNKKFSINTVRMWCDKNGSNPATSEKISQKFEAAWWWTSAVSAQNGIPEQSSETTWFWHILTAKRWICALSECFFKEKPSFFDKPAPKSNSPCLATSTRRKSHSFSVWVHYLNKNRSDRAHRVVHSSLCCMFHARNSVAIFIF